MFEENEQQQYVVVLKSATSDQEDDQALQHLGNVFSDLFVYEEPHSCMNFISDLSENNAQVFFVLMDIERIYLAELVGHWPQITSIYLYHRKSKLISTSNQSKVRLFTNDYRFLIKRLVRELALAQDIPPVLTPFTSDRTIFERSIRDLCSDHQASSFVWHQLLIDVICRLERDPGDKQKMIDFLRNYFRNDSRDLKNMDKFAAQYTSEDAVTWYRKPGFLFKLLNRAFRTQDVDIIFNLRYYIQDLYRQLETEYQKQRESFISMTVYRGQKMRDEDFQALCKAKHNNSFIAFNSFLSTSKFKDVARLFADTPKEYRASKTLVLFQISLNDRNNRIPMAYIADIGMGPDEEEVLIGTGSLFRVGQIQQNPHDDIWDVDLILHDQVNEQLCSMMTYLKEQMGFESSMLALGRYLGDMGDLDRSERYFRILLHQLPKDHPDIGTILNNLGILFHRRCQYDKAIDNYKQALEILPNDHGDRVSVNINLGACYQALGENVRALQIYREALKWVRFAEDRARIYNNMGCIYRRLRKLKNSMHYFKLSLESRSADDPSLVEVYLNMAQTYVDQDDQTNALTCCQKAEEAARILPSESMTMGKVYLTLGRISMELEKYAAAICYFENALDAYQKMKRCQTVANTIENINAEKDQALFCAQKIRSLKTISPDDDDAETCRSIGQSHDSQDRLSTALRWYKKALTIWMELPENNIEANPHSIAQLLYNVGEIYDKMRRYGLAMGYYDQAMKFARGDNELMMEIKQNFEETAKTSLYFLRRRIHRS